MSLGVKSVWGNPRLFTDTNSSEQPVDFRQVMSEDLAKELEEAEIDQACHTILPDMAKSTEHFYFDPDECKNDAMLACMLQMDFDREHDHRLRLEESKFNGKNKVSVSFKNYRSDGGMLDGDDDDSDSSTDEDTRELRRDKAYNKQSPVFGPSGLIRQNGELVSKHDKAICGRKNTARVMQFPPDFQSGDGLQDDLQLSNRVFNTLKSHSLQQERRRHRVHEQKEHSTVDLAMDHKTRLVLFKLVNGGYLESISGSISTGKEANVLHALGGQVTGQEIPVECAIKVYKTSLSEFKNRKEYVHEDYRFKNPRKVLKIWAEKEQMNLNRLRRGGVPCPSVVKLRRHVLVMSFIGKDHVPAPQLKNAHLSGEELHKAYQQCVEAIHTMYNVCSLVHADLSEFNVLWFDGQCFIIDVSQAVDASHPSALPFLARDCFNISVFFDRKGVKVKHPCTLFADVTGLETKKCDDLDQFCEQVSSFAAENRSEEKMDKVRPADADLRKAMSEWE